MCLPQSAEVGVGEVLRRLPRAVAANDGWWGYGQGVML